MQCGEGFFRRFIETFEEIGLVKDSLGETARRSRGEDVPREFTVHRTWINPLNTDRGPAASRKQY